MTLPRTAEAWLDWLAVQHPTDADWRDPEFVQLVSWALLLFYLAQDEPAFNRCWCGGGG